MREILFRGKCKYNGKWTEGYLVELGKESFSDNERYGICNKAIPLFGSGVCYNLKIDEVIQETIGQYTGLTDKNGKRIFEGDVCKNTKTGKIVSVQWHGTMAGYVWSKRKENNQHLFDFGELFRVCDKYEVIGNIHDNPELLKGGEG